MVFQNNKAGILKLSSFWFSLQRNPKPEMGRRPLFVSSQMVIWTLKHSFIILLSCKHIYNLVILVSLLGTL